MDTRTKKRIRARMARTGETYQAALNATREPAKPDASAAVLAPNPHPFELVCDLCGETVFDDPQHALITWFYLPDPPFEYVAGLYIAHKGACDDLVQPVRAQHGAEHFVDRPDERAASRLVRGITFAP